MKTTTVLFDLDGTLLPTDMDVFVKTYFGLLSRRMAPLGYEPEALVKGVWAGLTAMIENDGARLNEEVFWDAFARRMGPKVLEYRPEFDDFYRTDYQNLRTVCGFTPEAAKTVRLCRKLGFSAVLATNPVYPAVATRSRIRWAGLAPEDFDLCTTYENSRSGKPNLLYYKEVTAKLGLQPAQCLMVGNDAQEDMVAEKLGMKVFLLTDCLIDREKSDLSRWPHGDFAALQAYLEEVARDE